VLSGHDEGLCAERALRSGARGYITKQESIEHLAGAIKRVLSGQFYVSERLLQRLLPTSTLGSGQRDCATMSLPLPVSPTRRTLKCEAATVATRFAEHHGVDIWYSEERQLRRIPRFAQRKCRSRNHATPRCDCCVAPVEKGGVAGNGQQAQLSHRVAAGSSAPHAKDRAQTRTCSRSPRGTLCCKGILALRPEGAVLASGTWEASHDNDY
jgi:hypothetical protein